MRSPASSFLCIVPLFIFGCQPESNKARFQEELRSIDLLRGEIALCGADEAKFGTVDFGLSCLEKVRSNFNLAMALLHSFEYGEAEKVFVKVIDDDPDCLMAYWGVAMSNFHPLWAPPTREELAKGSKTIELARSLDSKSAKESDYLEAVATLYDGWHELDHKTRILKFEEAAEEIYQRYPDDKEAAIFYALALRAASEPTDKTFARQKKAGAILTSLFPAQPDHPGIAHYLIHTYDYPELASQALPAARQYAAIAATSAHALHMPSHIFTRLGLWDESVRSNINSMSAARCYAEQSGMQGHWDEEVHGLDYLVYALLQQGRDTEAKEQLDYLRSFESVSPVNNKGGYTFAAVPTRWVLERKDWQGALELQLNPAFPWENFLWEKSMVSFGRLLGAVHLKRRDVAQSSLAELQANHKKLVEHDRTYEAQQVLIQIRASEAWIALRDGKPSDAVRLMNEAADMEDATDKHPVTPGEVLPARELLGDLYMETGDYGKALQAYENDLERHAGRLNGVYGAAVSAERSGDREKARTYYQQVLALTQLSARERALVGRAEDFLSKNL